MEVSGLGCGLDIVGIHEKEVSAQICDSLLQGLLEEPKVTFFRFSLKSKIDLLNRQYPELQGPNRVLQLVDSLISRLSTFFFSLRGLYPTRESCIKILDFSQPF